MNRGAERRKRKKRRKKEEHKDMNKKNAAREKNAFDSAVDQDDNTSKLSELFIGHLL